MAVILAGFSLSKWIPNGFMHRHTQCATFFSSSEYNTVAEKWMPAKQYNYTFSPHQSTLTLYTYASDMLPNE